MPSRAANVAPEAPANYHKLRTEDEPDGADEFWGADEFREEAWLGVEYESRTILLRCSVLPSLAARLASASL